MLTVHNTFLELRRASTDGFERPRYSAPAAILSAPAARLQECVHEHQGGIAFNRSSAPRRATLTAPSVATKITTTGIRLSATAPTARAITVSRPSPLASARHIVGEADAAFRVSGSITYEAAEAQFVAAPCEMPTLPVGRPRTSTNMSLQSDRRRSTGFGGEYTPWEVGSPQNLSFGMGPAPLSPIVGGVVASGAAPTVPLMPAPAGMQQTQVVYAGAGSFPQGGYTYTLPHAGASSQSQVAHHLGGVQLTNGMYMQMPQSPVPTVSAGYVSRTVATRAAPSAPPGANEVAPPYRAVTSTVVKVQATSAASTGMHKSKQEVPVTTIMLRNIPLKFNREMVLEDMDNRGFLGCYDFFYLPIDFQTCYSVGYAFINFISNDEVNRFKSIYSGLRLASDSAKVCEINDAKVQGKFRNIEQYRNSAVMEMEEQYHPIICERGQRRPFPKPTHAPKPFRPRKDKRDGK